MRSGCNAGPCPPPDGSGPCGIEHALSVLAGKWTLVIIRELLAGTRRFTQIRRASGTNSKSLTVSLRLLEDNDLIARRIHAEVPPRVEYP